MWENGMRVLVLFCVAVIGVAFGTAGTASAGVKTVVKTRTYDITGATGAGLVVAMNRRGPKHGFMTHAIAQTSYTADWSLDLAQVNGVCRVRQANGTLNITYTYPHVASAVTPALRKRWNRFFTGVLAHEGTHGRIAGQMMQAAERSVRGLKFANDPQCNKTRAEGRRRLEATSKLYEAKQIAFDAREHSEGGHVERIIEALVGL